MDGSTFLFIAETFDVAGKLLIAYTALKVHHRVWQEHKIDDKVFYSMKRESRFGVFGVALIIIGYLMEVYLNFLA